MTPHFTLKELTATQTGLPNEPDDTALVNLRRLAERLEAVRALLGHRPVVVFSGYRSARVNRFVGGSATSAHQLGLAADFVCSGYGTPLEVCRAIEASGIEFDQLIHEHDSWVHLGIGPKQRRQTLTIDDRGTRAGLHEARP